jgi:hypothetical protein
MRMVPILTTDEVVFQAQLRPGDVLLFEKLLRVSSLIMWADLRAVSHAAVVVSADSSGCRIVDATLRPKPSAVEETPLSDLLHLVQRDARGEVPTVRSITARRCPAAQDDRATGAAIATEARAFVHEARYALFDLGAIAPYAYLRTSARKLPRGFAPMLHGLIQVSRSLVAARAPRGQQAVTCSELVYRAMSRVNGGALGPSINAPLIVGGRFRANWVIGGPKARAFSLDEAFEDSDDGAELGAVNPEAEIEPSTLAEGQRELELLADDVARAKLLEEGEKAFEAPPLEEADGVTPGDLLESPSLETIAVLHRPLL